jgi:rifampicin phosphotransferase
VLASGKIKGEVIIISSKKDINKDISGKVIVAKEITLEILPKMYDVKGVVVENGSILSHVSIFLREIGIPMVKIKNATKIYKTGEIIDIK